MTCLIRLSDHIKNHLQHNQVLPFSVFHCYQAQFLHLVPIFQPTLIFVLRGQKGFDDKSCHAGEFIFLRAGQNVMLSNQPDEQEYLALLLELQPQDLVTTTNNHRSPDNFIAAMPQSLSKSLEQMADWAAEVDKQHWYIRRREIVQLLLDAGFSQLANVFNEELFSSKVSRLLQQQPAKNWTQADLCQQLAISEATLRRRLVAEGTSFRNLLESVRMGLGLNLLQTTQLPVALVAERCGYQSASRFSERFKQRFQLTPSQLRKTQSA